MNTASRFISQACDIFCIRAKFGLAHRHKVKFKQIFAIIMDKNSKGKQVQTYDKIALLGFVLTQNALKSLFTTLAHKAITRTSLSLSLSLSLVSQLFICDLFFQSFKSLCSFCHFGSFTEKRKIYKDKRKLTIFGYFACAQYELFVSNIDIW